jgi:hypothetical protein
MKKTIVMYRPVSANACAIVTMSTEDCIFLAKTRQLLPNGLKTAAKIALAYESYKNNEVKK